MQKEIIFKGRGVIMSGNMRDTVVWVLLMLSFVYAYKAFAKPVSKNNIALEKVYHHTNDIAAAGTLLEEGTVIFYFSEKILPIVLRKQILQNGWEECAFFFKNVIASDEIRPMIDQFTADSTYYTTSIALVKRPEQGLTFTIRYDPAHITFSYGSIFSISAKPGIVFRFINKKVKENLANEFAAKRTSCLVHNTAAPIIVIDAGHGGTDIGAVGPNGLTEKELSLAIAQKIATQLSDKGYGVYLTRDSDCTVSLSDRTKQANRLHATMLVSIHANAAKNSNARGVETFYPDHSAIQYVYSTFAGQDLTFIDAYFRQQDAISKRYAQIVQQVLHPATQDAQGVNFRDRGAKPAPSQLLLGAHVPALLIEVGFLTHEQEVQFLSLERYQAMLAQKIAYALLQCLEQNPGC